MAIGFTALQRFDVIHGIFKRDKLLVFRRDGVAHVIIVDFDHSLLNSNETTTLVGGSEMYAALERGKFDNIGLIMRTDDYFDVFIFVVLALGLVTSGYI